jgi:hypothetical protein
MLTTIYLICAACSLALVVAGLRHLRAAPSLALALTLPAIIAILYDNLVIAMGRTLGEGPLLVALTWPRFVLHVLVLPPLIVAMLLLTRGAGVRWASRRAAMIVALLLAAATLAAGVISEVMRLELAASYRGDILFYTHAHPAGPPPGAIMLLVGAIIYGGAITLRARWPWLALAALYTLLAVPVPDDGLSGALVNLGEVLLMGAMLLAVRRFVDALAPRSSPVMSVE